MSRGWIIGAATLVVATLVAGAVFFSTRGGDVALSPSPTPPGPDVVPVDDPAASPDIVWLTQHGFFIPGEDGSDAADRLVDRALLAVVWARMQGVAVGPCTGSEPVADVDAASATCSAIATAYARNVVGAENADAFRPNHRLTRAELARFLYLDTHPDNRADACTTEAPFSDVPATDARCEAIRWATAAGSPAILPPESDTEFGPIKNVDLATFAHALRRHYELFAFEGEHLEFEVAPGVIVYGATEPVGTQRHVVAEAKFLPDGTVVSPEIAEWTVLLAPDAEMPSVGTGVFVEPGGPTTPEGLAGRVTSVATHGDGTVELTVGQAPLGELFLRLEGFASGPLPGYEPDGTAGPSGMARGLLGITPRSVPLTGCSPASGNLGLSMRGLAVSASIPPPRLTVDFSLGSATETPYITVEIYTEASLSIDVESAFAINCTIDLLPAPVTVPVGGPVTVGFMPYLELSLEMGVGSDEPLFRASAYASTSVTATPEGATPKASAGASLRVAELSSVDKTFAKVSAGLGVEIQVGILGMVGVYVAGAIEGWLAAELAAVVNRTQLQCYSHGFDFSISGGVFFQVVFIGVDIEIASLTVPIYTSAKTCHNKAVDPSKNTGGKSPSKGEGKDSPPPPPPAPPTVDQLRKLAMETATEAGEIADFAEQQAQLALEAAERVQTIASGNPFAMASAQSAAAAAQEAADAAAEARTAANEAYAAAVAALTANQANAAILLAEAALAKAEAGEAAARAAAAAAEAIFELLLPITHNDPTAPTITMATGDVWSLGPGDIHAWGDPMREPYLLPVKVPSVPAVRDVVTSNAGAVLLGTNGQVWTWGYGSEPVQLPGLSNITQIWGCEGQVYAQSGGGVFYAWGDHDGWSQMVPVAGASGAVPPTVVPEFTNVAQLDCDASGAIVRTASGAVWEWGLRADYGSEGPGPVFTPRLVDLPFPAIDVEASYGSNCAVLTDTRVWCWRTFMGSVATDPFYYDWGNYWTYYPEPLPIYGLTGVVDVTVATTAWFAITEDGTLYAWGNNRDGYLGHDPDVVPEVLVPVAVPGLPPIKEFKANYTGFHWTGVALAEDGTVWTWGDNSRGGLGDGTLVNRWYPVQVPRISDIVAIDFLYTGHIYALDARGTLWFWGESTLFHYVGYDFSTLPYGASLRPVAVSHFDNVGDFAFNQAQLIVWAK